MVQVTAATKIKNLIGQINTAHAETAAAAGRAAGNRAGFGRPVNGGRAPRAISKN